MKINWGTGIVIGMVLFIAFIMTMVVIMVSNEKFDHQMVTESYYEEGMVYQEEIDAETNTKDLSSPLKVQKIDEGWLLIFPDELTATAVEGVVQMYRPSNEKLDFNLPLELHGSSMVIPKDLLVEGNWKINIRWEMGGKPYLFKKDLVY